MNLFAGQDRITKWALCITFLFAVVLIASWSNGTAPVGPAMAALGLHGIWIAIAYRKKVKISKTGLEFEEDEEDSKP